MTAPNHIDPRGIAHQPTCLSQVPNFDYRDCNCTPMLVVWCCQNCDGHIFIVDMDNPDGSSDGPLWAHLEDTGCDDPVRVPGSQTCIPPREADPGQWTFREIAWDEDFPPCDFCKLGGAEPIKPARYDIPSIIARTWGNSCEAHMRIHYSPASKLGLKRIKKGDT